MIRHARRFLNCCKGIATIEAALILPIISAVTLAAADAGLMMLNVHRIETGLEAGGAYLARSNDVEADKDKAILVAVTGHAASGYASIVDGWSTNDVTVTVQTVQNTSDESEIVLRGADTIRVVHFTTRYTYSGLGLLRLVGVGDITLSVNHEERIFGGGV